MKVVLVRIKIRTGITRSGAAWSVAVILWALGWSLMAIALPSPRLHFGMEVAAPHIGAPLFIEPAPGSGKAFAGRPCGRIEGEVLRELVRDAAERHAIGESVLLSMVQVESAGHPCAVSPKGAAGILQLMPQTARYLGVRSRHDPVQSLNAGARYLKVLLARYGNDLRLALAAYNAGPAWVDRYRDVPPFRETQSYVRKVMKASQE